MHRALVFLVSLIVVLAFANAFGAAETEPRGELIDRVWSGQPTGFSFVIHGERIYVAYYDAARRITVASRVLAGEEWLRAHPDGWWLAKRNRNSNGIGWDSHNSLAMAFDKEGFLHLAGNMHGDPLIYFRSERPFDIASLKSVRSMTGEREDECTYPVFFKNAEGDLVFRYRDGRSGSGSDIYNIYDTASRTWRRLVNLAVLDGEKARSAYAKAPELGPDGWFHMIWMWRDTPDVVTNHDLSYVRSRDLVQWQDIRGKSVELPITLANGDVVDGAQPRSGLVNTTYRLGFDREKRPVVVYHRYDSAGDSQLYIARFESGAWKIRQITQWDFRWQFGGYGSINVDVALADVALDDCGRIVVSYWTRAHGAGRLALRSDDLGLVETLPAAQSVLPDILMAPQNAAMIVHTLVAEKSGATVRGERARFVLRWETLPENRDQPRSEAPPASELLLYRVE